MEKKFFIISVMRKTVFLSLLAIVFLFSCGKSPEEIKKEEEKTELSAPEKVEHAKNLLSSGLVSDAKKLFSEALPELSKNECVQGEIGKTCLYCDALYGKFIADFYGTLGLLGQLLETLQSQSKAKMSPKQMEGYDALISGSVEMLVGTLIQKIDSQREDLMKIIQDDCEFKSSVTVSLNLLGKNIILPAISEEKREFLYSPIFAQLNYAVLSLLVGFLDIAYTQNFAVSVTQTFAFLKELLKLSEEGKSFTEIIPYTADFFAKNPALLTQNNERVSFWQKSSQDLASSLTNIVLPLQKIGVACDKGEATKFILESLLGSLIQGGGINLDLCSSLIQSALSTILSSLEGVLNKWADGILGKAECKEEKLDSKSVVRNTDENLGCIRFPDDLATLGLIADILSSMFPKSLSFAFNPNKFFSVPTTGEPKHLRALLPLVKDIGGKYVFAIEVDPQENVFQGDFLTLAKGFPTAVTEDISFLKSCVEGEGIFMPRIFIPFGDPTLFGSLYFYAVCEEASDLNLGEKGQYWELPDLRRGNFAINALLSPIVSRLLE